MPLTSALSLGLLALLLGLGLGIAAKIFGVKRDEREEKALEILPGANCGACGYPGCQAFASALVKGEASVAGCPAGGAEARGKLADILGIELEEAVPYKAVVRCAGTKKAAPEKYSYSGVESCLAASLLANGPKACQYGCLGFGDCVRSCPFDALSMRADGLPEVDRKKCTGCGICVKTCPKGIMELMPENRRVFIGCVSRGKGKAVKEVCSAGCIACGICAKVSPEGAVVMDDNLPVIKTKDDMDLEKAVEKCPVKIILKV
jgi:Na+-translocating ferredoxin:NAD+ oxidoreductase subunit B